jgi:hypothetical protein
MHRMSNLNKFKESYQVLEKKSKALSHEKKISNIHKECLNKFFWPKIFTTNILCVNVYTICECDKNQMPYYNVKNLQMSKFWEFWAIDRT